MLAEAPHAVPLQRRTKTRYRYLAVNECWMPLRGAFPDYACGSEMGNKEVASEVQQAEFIQARYTYHNSMHCYTRMHGGLAMQVRFFSKICHCISAASPGARCKVHPDYHKSH